MWSLRDLNRDGVYQPNPLWDMFFTNSRKIEDEMYRPQHINKLLFSDDQAILANDKDVLEWMMSNVKNIIRGEYPEIMIKHFPYDKKIIQSM